MKKKVYVKTNIFDGKEIVWDKAEKGARSISATKGEPQNRPMLGIEAEEFIYLETNNDTKMKSVSNRYTIEEREVPEITTNN